MNSPVTDANPVKSRSRFSPKTRAVVAGVLVMLGGVVVWALGAWIPVWRAEREDVKLAHATVLAWWAKGRPAPDFSVFDRMGKERALSVLRQLEQDRRIVIIPFPIKNR